MGVGEVRVGRGAVGGGGLPVERPHPGGGPCLCLGRRGGGEGEGTRRSGGQGRGIYADLAFIYRDYYPYYYPHYPCLLHAPLCV